MGRDEGAVHRPGGSGISYVKSRFETPQMLTMGIHAVDDLFAAFSQCAAAFPTDTSPEDGLDDGAIFADADGEAAEGEGEGEDLSEAGRVRADFSTPSSRYAPY